MEINQNKKTVDVTLLITFHSEGILAHTTLNSIERCREYAEKAGISTECVWVLDSIDNETQNVLLAHPAYSGNTTIIYVDYLDAGASRNAGIKVACGSAIAVLDGDDYYSTNWIEQAWLALKKYGVKTIFHPEIVVSFGIHSVYARQVDQDDESYDKLGLLMYNYWSAWMFASRSVYENCPYVIARTTETGFGYEDWHWNCETIAAGFQHRLVPETIGFYRKKNVSRVNLQSSMDAIIPPTRLFDKKYLIEGITQ